MGEIEDTIEEHGPLELDDLLLRVQNQSEGLTKEVLRIALRELAKRNRITHTSNHMIKSVR